jgi:hypothetical protein
VCPLVAGPVLQDGGHVVGDGVDGLGLDDVTSDADADAGGGVPRTCGFA